MAHHVAPFLSAQTSQQPTCCIAQHQRPYHTAHNLNTCPPPDVLAFLFSSMVLMKQNSGKRDSDSATVSSANGAVSERMTL